MMCVHVYVCIDLVSELSGAHHFNDVEGCPTDVITHHLELLWGERRGGRKGAIKQ